MFEYCALVVVVGLLLYYHISRDNNSKEPPGPRPWPILGNLLDMAIASPNVILIMGKLSEKYGEIYSLKMGMKRTVILTSKEAIQTVLSDEGSLSRDRSGMLADRSFNKNLGIVTGDGEVWEKSRSWTFKNLRNFGFGKTLQMEHYVQSAAETLFAHIDDTQMNADGVNMELLFHPPIMTIMWQMIVGRLSPADILDIKHLTDNIEALAKSAVFGAGLTNAFPFLRFIFPKNLGYDVQMHFFSSCDDVSNRLFSETETRLKITDSLNEPPSNLLEAFLQNCNSGDVKVFNCENFRILFQDLLLASTETTSSYLEYVMLYLITYPDIQEKLYQEILQVAEDGREFLEFEDKKKMIYTQAFLLEAHRNARTVQNGVPRKSSKDIYYKDYVIKKGTVIIVDMRLYYEDKEKWTDPEVFRPERFINEKGELCNGGSIISFGVGRRMCPGELYANVVSFLMLTSLLQRYKLGVPKGQPKPRMDQRPGMTLKPYPFQVTFTKRN